MPISYPDVAALLQIHPRWLGFDACMFELRVHALDDVLDQFVTCWGHGASRAGTLTFDAYLTASGGPNAKVQGLANTLDVGRPVLAVAFSKNVLHSLWAAAYPDAGPELVVMDGNHRLTALAVRRGHGLKDAIVVGTFVCG